MKDSFVLIFSFLSEIISPSTRGNVINVGKINKLGEKEGGAMRRFVFVEKTNDARLPSLTY